MNIIRMCALVALQIANGRALITCSLWSFLTGHLLQFWEIDRVITEAKFLES